MNQGYKRQKHETIQVLEENLNIGKDFVTMLQNPDVIEEMVNKIIYIFLSYTAKITMCYAVLSHSVVSDSLWPHGL